MRTVFLLALLCGAIYAAEQRGFMHFGRSCLALNQDAWVDEPMKDGEPDLAHASVHGLVVDKNCGMIQVKRIR